MPPNRRTNSSATRRDSPVSVSARAISIAPSSSHSDGSPNPDSARSTPSPPTTIAAMTPINTIAAAGSGWRINPASVATNTPNCRQPAAVTDGARGHSTTAAYTATMQSRLLVRADSCRPSPRVVARLDECDPIRWSGHDPRPGYRTSCVRPCAALCHPAERATLVRTQSRQLATSATIALTAAAALRRGPFAFDSHRRER